VVQRIMVQGNERIEQTTVLSYLPIQPGDTVDPALLDLALKTLARTDLFADVKIELQERRPGGQGRREPDHQPGAVRREQRASRKTSCATR
jgi:outer membrane translocation and assembly module TamA